MGGGAHGWGALWGVGVGWGWEGVGRRVEGRESRACVLVWYVVCQRVVRRKLTSCFAGWRARYGFVYREVAVNAREQRQVDPCWQWP